MNAADSARRENANPGATGKRERGGNGRRSVGSCNDRRRNVASRDFANAIAREKSFELIALETDCRNPLYDRGDRRQRSCTFDGCHHSLGGLAVLRNWKSLREHRAL